MRDIVIIGAGSWSRSIVPLFNLEDRISQFYDVPRYEGETIMGVPVQLELVEISNTQKFISVIGDTRHKKKLIHQLFYYNPNFINLIWEDNIIVETARIGRGVMIQPTAKIYHNATIGNHVSICGDGNIGHDSKIGDYCTLGPYVLLCGGVKAKEGAFLGAGCKIHPNLTIGEGAVVGMGAIVLKDVPPNQVVVGNPARDIKTMELWE